MGNKIVEGLSALTTSTQEVTPEILVLEFTVVTWTFRPCRVSSKTI